MNLEDGDIILSRSDDRTYLLELAKQYPYHRYSAKEHKENLKFIKYLWIGYAKGIKAGIIFLSYMKAFDWWTLDAYRNDARVHRIDRNGNYSLRSAKLVLDWFFNSRISENMYTMHDIRNRAATLACKRLGFKETRIINDFIILEMGCESWGSKQRL